MADGSRAEQQKAGRHMDGTRRRDETATRPGERLSGALGRWARAVTMPGGSRLGSRLLYAAPVVVTAAMGAVWVAMAGGGGRGQAHTVWQSLVVAESTVALLLRRRKPAGSLAGILLVYAVFALHAITVVPALVALFTVARTRGRRGAVLAAAVTAAVFVLFPYLPGGTVSVLAWVGLPLAAGLTAAAGMGARAWQLRERLG
jgi:hypothetical protein